MSLYPHEVELLDRPTRFRNYINSLGDDELIEFCKAMRPNDFSPILEALEQWADSRRFSPADFYWWLIEHQAELPGLDPEDYDPEEYHL
ncbi:hypothetical protein BI308_25470 [Roseofilum reptotaenium AO1-A]|uniref:Uncharacterized protein n=1 Tax=Roseofilum reptotaenium AO1-A TaxID=1925591 RepID=A0A1L9QJB6_9CYAN|nr:hypothetical protein BI308_25470 [Roseofilum reptotaenium AO1-A]